MTVKKIYIIVSIIILTILLFFFVKDKRERDLTQRGEYVIERIELFRKKNHRLPKDLNEIGIMEEENSNGKMDIGTLRTMIIFHVCEL